MYMRILCLEERSVLGIKFSHHQHRLFKPTGTDEITEREQADEKAGRRSDRFSDIWRLSKGGTRKKRERRSCLYGGGRDGLLGAEEHFAPC